VGQGNRQTLPPKFPCFGLLIPHFTLSFKCAKYMLGHGDGHQKDQETLVRDADIISCMRDVEHIPPLPICQTFYIFEHS
jgi:hypothetical protein